MKIKKFIKPVAQKINFKRFYMFSVLGLLLCIFICVGYFFINVPAKNARLKTEGFAVQPHINFYKINFNNQIGDTLPYKQWMNKWILFYVSPASCNDECHAMLQSLQHLSLERSLRKSDTDVVISSFENQSDNRLNNLLGTTYPHFIHVYLQINEFKRAFVNTDSIRRAIFAGMLYIVNPKGKIILGYFSDTSFNSLRDVWQKLRLVKS
jgi:hypothetical protein